MVGWHRLNGHEFEQAPGDDEGQGSLACCSPWGYEELDMTKLLNNSNKRDQHNSITQAPCLWLLEFQAVSGERYQDREPISSPTLSTSMSWSLQ